MSGALAIASLSAFVGLYLLAFPRIGAAGSLLVMLPILVAAGTRGLYAGLVAAIVGQLTLFGLWQASGVVPGDTLLRVGNGVGFVVVLGLAAVIGYLRDLSVRLSQHAREVEALGDAARAMNEAATRADAVGAILDAALRVMPGRVATLALVRQDDTDLDVVAAAGVPLAEWLGRRTPVTLHQSGRAYCTRTTQLIGDLRITPDNQFDDPLLRSLISVPVVTARRTLGVLTIAADAVGAFGRREARILESFAAHAANTIETHRLVTELRSGEARLRGVLDAAALCIFATDQRGVCTYAAGIALAELWNDAQPLVGQTLPTVFRVLNPALADAVHDALTGGAGDAAIATTGRAFALHYAPVYAEGPEGGVTGMVGVAVETAAVIAR